MCIYCKELTLIGYRYGAQDHLCVRWWKGVICLIAWYICMQKCLGLFQPVPSCKAPSCLHCSLGHYSTEPRSSHGCFVETFSPQDWETMYETCKKPTRFQQHNNCGWSLKREWLDQWSQIFGIPQIMVVQTYCRHIQLPISTLLCLDFFNKCIKYLHTSVIVLVFGLSLLIWRKRPSRMISFSPASLIDTSDLFTLPFFIST